MRDRVVRVLVMVASTLLTLATLAAVLWWWGCRLQSGGA